jgi:hypothetical protein
MPAHKKPANTTRSETVTVRLDPKLFYLAGLAAKEQQRTLSNFIEWAVRHALTAEVMLEDEPTPGTEPTFKKPAPLWNEGLWDVDEADRFFLLGSRPDLMSDSELTLWKLLTEKLSRKNGKFNLQQFRELWDEFVGGIRRDAGITE